MSRFVVKKETEGVWKPDPFFKLPKGVTVKVLRHDRRAGVLDLLIKRPEGYVEPRHTHKSTHYIVVLDGRVDVAGKELKAGGYIYAPPGLPHGPFVWHDDCVVFAHFEGDPVHHYKKP